MANSKIKIPNLKSDLAPIALVFIFILNVAYNYYWVKADTAPPAWDQSLHMIKSVEYYYKISDISSNMPMNYLYFYPPLYPFSTAIFYLFFGHSSDASIMVNSIYLGILLFSIYGIGTRLFDKKTGVIAAVLISLFPAVFNLRLEFLIDFALIAMVSLTIYFLIACDYFRNRNYSLMFGIALALSMLTKWTAIIFIIGPLVYIISKAFILSQRSNSGFVTDIKQKSNFLYSLVLSVALSGIWYIPNINIVYSMVIGRLQSIGAYEGDPEIFTAKSFLYYFFADLNSISFVFFLIFLAGFIVLLKRRSNSALLLYLIIAIPYLAFTLIRNKDLRYTTPIVVSISVIAAVFIASIKNKKLLASAVLLISLFGVAQLFPQEIGLKSIDIQTSYGPLYLFGPEAKATVNHDWKVEDIVEDIYQDAKSNNRIIIKGFGYIGVIPDMPYVNGLTYEYYSYSNKLPLIAINCAYLGFDEFSLNLFNFDYIIVRSGKNEGSPNDKDSEDMKEYFYNNKSDSYIQLKQYKLPDNTILSVYKNVAGY